MFLSEVHLFILWAQQENCQSSLIWRSLDLIKWKSLRGRVVFFCFFFVLKKCFCSWFFLLRNFKSEINCYILFFKIFKQVLITSALHLQQLRTSFFVLVKAFKLAFKYKVRPQNGWKIEWLNYWATITLNQKYKCVGKFREVGDTAIYSTSKYIKFVVMFDCISAKFRPQCSQKLLKLD